MLNHAPLRVASVPHGHVYVRHLALPDGPDGVVRLDDPPPPGSPDATPSGAPWWPARMLDPDWVAEHADDFDVYHLHFGFESESPADLGRLVETLRAHGKPLVYTVHDLRNPHQVDPVPHEANLEVLIPSADALITLTPGAAIEVERRWGRPDVHVVPHPHVVDIEDLTRPRPPRDRPTVGLHLKSLRPNLNPIPVLDALLAAAPARGWDVLIDVHSDVVTPGAPNHDASVAAVLDDAAARDHVRVRVHDYFSDAELWDYVLSLDLSVLAYRFGTHSGWLEACYDLGTRVLAPRLGHYHEQHEGVLGYRVSDDGTPVAEDVAAALDAAAAREPWRAGAQERLDQRRAVAEAHSRLYRAALAGGAT